MTMLLLWWMLRRSGYLSEVAIGVGAVTVAALEMGAAAKLEAEAVMVAAVVIAVAPVAAPAAVVVSRIP